MSTVIQDFMTLIQTIPTPIIVFAVISMMISTVVPIIILVLIVKYLRNENGQKLVGAAKTIASEVLNKLKEVSQESKNLEREKIGQSNEENNKV